MPANKLFPEEGGSSTFIGAGLGKVRFGSAGFFSSATATSVEDAAEAEADDAEALDPDLSEAEDALVPGEFASSSLVTETFPPEEFAGLLAQEEMQEAMRKENPKATTRMQEFLNFILIPKRVNVCRTGLYEW